MARIIAALIAGIVFGAGLAISQMINPAKVLAFLDVAGEWDPSLAFVMLGAVAVTAVGYRVAFRRQRPAFDTQFHVPTRSDVDARLITGAAVFGAGWGLAGYCPGPALAGLAGGAAETVVFVASMAGAMILANWAESRSGDDRRPAPSRP